MTHHVQDSEQNLRIPFGPVPSRRLGRSLGINNVPPKTCSYSCVYCQIGLTNPLVVSRREFFTPDAIYSQTAFRISELRRQNQEVDYLTFVPDGEPTLDANLGATINKLRALGIRIAVITNSSLIWDPEVRNDLANADWVSLKMDSVKEETWRKINRPHGALKIGQIMDGAINFSSSFTGTLVTETMLVNGVNDSPDLVRKTAGFVAELAPSKAYILAPTRPPAENWVLPPDEERLNVAYQVFNERIKNVELLVYSEGSNFAFTGDAERELLAILAVHPMNTEAVRQFLEKARSGWSLIENLIAARAVRQVEYAGKSYIVKILESHHRR